MFGFFNNKKKDEKPPQPAQPHYDPLNIKITDIRVGFILDYNFKTWEVTDEFEYDWGDNNFSYEYKLSSEDGQEVFLSIDFDDELELMVMQKIKIHKLGDNIDVEIQRNGRPPSKLVVDGITYYRESESPGFWRNTARTPRHESVEMIVWDYYDDTEKHVIAIEQWGDQDFEAAIGILEPPMEFTNILPGNKLQ